MHQERALTALIVLFSIFGVSILACLGILFGLARARSLHVQERQAWFTLGVSGVALITWLTLYMIVTREWGLSVEPLFAVFGLFGFFGLQEVFVRRERRQGRIAMDERDHEIARRANLAAFSVFWVVFVLVCMAPFFIKGPNATLTIRTTTLSMTVLVGMLIVFTVRALATVVLYRRGAHGEEAA